MRAQRLDPMVEGRAVCGGALERVGDAGADQIGKIGGAAAAPQRLPVDEPSRDSVGREQDIVDAKVAMNERSRAGSRDR